MMKKISVVVILAITVVLGAWIIIRTRNGDFKKVVIPEQSSDQDARQEREILPLDRLIGPYEKISPYAVSDKFSVAEYVDGGKRYADVNGRKFGPYDTGDNEFALFALASNTDWLFSFFRDGKYFVNADGKELGPFEKDQTVAQYEMYIGNVTVEKGFGFSFRKDGKYFFNINGSQSGPFDSAENLEISQNGKWIASYQKDGKYFVRTEEKEFGPYDADENSPADARIDGDSFAFNFQRGGKYHVNVNGREFGPYDLSDEIYELALSESNSIFNYTRNGKWYVSANDKEYGPYDIDSVPENLAVSGDRWGFSYETQDGAVVVIDGKESGPFVDIGDYTIDGVETSKSHTGYSVTSTKEDSDEEEEESLAFIDGNKYGPYDYSELDIEGDRWVIVYQKGDKWGIIADNGEFGPYFYGQTPKDDPGKEIADGNAPGFVFTEDGLVFDYQKENGGKWFINADGREFGPYDGVDKFNVQYSSNKNNFAFSYIMDGKWNLKIGKK